MAGSPSRRWRQVASRCERLVSRGGIRCGARGFNRAALDAAAGRRWVHEPVVGDGVGPRYSTQRRWLGQSARLLGLSADLGRSTVEQIVVELGLVGSEHAVQRGQYAASRSLSGRAQEVVSVLEQVSSRDGLWSRVLAAGHLAGLWGPPWLCDVHSGHRFSPLSMEGRWRRGPPAVRT